MATLTDAELIVVKARLATLKAARDTGVLIVRHGDTSTQFRNLEEIQEIIAELEDDIADTEGAAPRTKIRYARQCSKGL